MFALASPVPNRKLIADARDRLRRHYAPHRRIVDCWRRTFGMRCRGVPPITRIRLGFGFQLSRDPPKLLELLKMLHRSVRYLTQPVLSAICFTRFEQVFPALFLIIS